MSASLPSAGRHLPHGVWPTYPPAGGSSRVKSQTLSAVSLWNSQRTACKAWRLAAGVTRRACPSPVQRASEIRWDAVIVMVCLCVSPPAP